jgi:hypothetical protein
MNNIRAALADYRHVADRMRDEFLGEDEGTLRDTILGETYLDEAIAALLREAHVIRATAEKALREIKAEMARREERLHARADRLEALAMWATQEAGWKKIEAPDFIASINPGRAKVVITDEASLPLKYLSFHPPTRTPDKKELGKALQEGEVIRGAELGNRTPYWTIRR